MSAIRNEDPEHVHSAFLLFVVWKELRSYLLYDYVKDTSNQKNKVYTLD